jgi:S-formylglutathione hydrolase FrmB
MNILKKCLLFCFLLSASTTFAQQGKVIEEQTVKSKALKRTVKYTIYLPADYETANRTYPVVYLLHGYTDDNTGWLQFGEVNRYADKAIADGTIPPMIIVMPNADSSWYINSYDGKEKYEDFFIKEFIPHIEQAYRAKTDKRYRGVAGLSMGGYGTMIYAIKYPQLFSAAAALSAAVFPDEDLTSMPDDNYERVFGQLYGRGLKGKDRLSKTWEANSVLGLIQSKTTDDLNKVRYWIDCGDDDGLSKGNSLMHIALMEKNVPHEFRVRDGAHNWTYWRTGITNALNFMGDSFRQK